MKHRATLIAAIAAAACTGPSEPSRPSPRVLEHVTPANFAAVVGTESNPAPTVRLKDQHGNPIAGILVVFSAGSGTLLNYAMLTDVDGTATVGRWTLGTRSGNQTVMAQSSGLAPVSFTAAARAGPVAAITHVAGNRQYGVRGAALPNPLSVRVADAFSNPVAGIPVTFAVIAGDGSIVDDRAATDSAGIAVSGVWTLGPAGTQQVSARSEIGDVVFEAVACEAITWGCAAFDDAATTLAFVRGGQLYRASLDGTQVVQLTNDGGGYNYSPAWSPDRSRIAFVRYDGQGGRGIYIMKAGGELTRRTNAGDNDSPAWSPDGRQLAFTAFESGLGTSVYVMSADGDGTKPIRLAGGWSPTWSPDGSRIAFLSAGGIYAINTDGTGLSKLISSNRWFGDLAWSPDGRSIAVTVYSNCDWDDDCDTSIEVLDLGSSQIRVLVLGSRGKKYASGPDWSPDGRTIAFTEWACTAAGCSQTVSAINVDGTGERVIIAQGHSPSWRR